MRNMIITIIAFVLIEGCSSNNLIGISEENNITGKWSESFMWKHYYGGQPSLERTTTMEFVDENLFNVKVLPPWRTFLYNDNSVYIGYADDTLYTGSYELVNDTIIFFRDDYNIHAKMTYNIEDDSLSLHSTTREETIINSSDTSIVIFGSLGEFIWSNCMMKHYGSFQRIK